MVGHDAGGGIGTEVAPFETRCVSIHDKSVLLRGDDFGQHLLVTLQHTWHIHHLGKAQHTFVLQKRQEIIRREHTIGAFERRGRDAR